MTIGLLVCDEEKIQIVVADRGGLDIILKCLQFDKESPKLMKWAIWSSIVS